MSTKKLRFIGIEIPVNKVTIQAVVLTVVLAMIVVIPLLSGTDALKDFGKTLVFELFGCLLLGLMLSQISLSSEALTALKRRLTVGPTLPIILLVLYSAVSYHFAPYESFARGELFRLLFCTLVYVTTALYFKGIGRLQLLVDTLLLVGALVSLVSLFSVGNDPNATGVTGTFGTHETLGSFLLLILPIALPIALTDIGEQKRQIFAQVVTLLIAAALLMAHTRSSWLGTACALSALAILYWRFPIDAKPSLSATQKRALQIGPAIILASAVVLFVLTSQQSSGLFERAGTIAHLNADQSAGVRHQMMIGAERMIRERPLFGWGIGSYPMLSYRFTHYGSSPSDILKYGLTLRNNAHSYYLEYAAEQGLVGLAFYFAVIAGFFVASLSSLKMLSKGLRKMVVIGCICATVGQLVDAAISPSYSLPAISMFQYLIFGIGMLAARGVDLPPLEEPIADVKVSRRRKPTIYST